MRTGLIFAAVMAALIFGASTASADSIGFGPSATFVDGGNIVLNLAISPTTTTIDGMNLTFQGDFGQAGEFLTVIIEGTTIGTLAPGLTSTGAFTTPVALFGSNFNLDPMATTAALALDVSAAVADGFLTVVFDASAGVAAFGPGTQIGQGVFTGINGFSLAVAGDITFTSNPVPEPGSIALLGLGLAGLGFASRRRKAKTS